MCGNGAAAKRTRAGQDLCAANFPCDNLRFMGTKVYMETWVKVKENWRDNVNFIRSQGYNEE